MYIPIGYKLNKGGFVMKTTRFFVLLFACCVLMVVSVSFAEEDGADDLHYDRFYLVLPEMDPRAAPKTPGKVDAIVAGQEVEVLSTEGIWTTFKYIKNGEEKTACTWTGAISPAVRIHLLNDEFIFRLPYDDREDYGLIASWREPSDPDLLILWEEMHDDQKWYYVVILPDCRGGYMKATAQFEIVE